MSDERDREQERTSSDAVNGETGNAPTDAASPDQDRAAPQEPEAVKTDAVIEDRFEATDN